MKIPRFTSLNSQTGEQSKDMLSLYQRWARIGPTNRSWLIHTPKAGLCLSTFVIVIDPENRILIGLPKKHGAWPEQGGLPLMHAAELEKEKKYLLPATHLMKEESIYSPGANHWDICFVYTMHASSLPSQIKPWWKEMKFILPSEIRELGRGHLDILEEGGFLKRRVST